LTVYLKYDIYFTHVRNTLSVRKVGLGGLDAGWTHDLPVLVGGGWFDHVTHYLFGWCGFGGSL